MWTSSWALRKRFSLVSSSFQTTDHSASRLLQRPYVAGRQLFLLRQTCIRREMHCAA